MKPNIIVRKGNKFVIDEPRLLPYLNRSKDLVMAAVGLACEKLKESPDEFDSNPVKKLNQLNELVYSHLKEWGVYKDRNET